MLNFYVPLKVIQLKPTQDNYDVLFGYVCCLMVLIAFIEPSELTGATNLMAYHGLEHTYNKLCSKKVKEELSAFLPQLPGIIDTPGSVDNRCLNCLCLCILRVTNQMFSFFVLLKNFI